MTDRTESYDLPTVDDDYVEVEIPRKDIPEDDLEMLEKFLQSRWRSDRVTLSSYEGYEQNLSVFFEWLDENGLRENPITVTSSDIVRFGEQMKSQYAETTIDGILTCVSAFYNYFERQSEAAAVKNPVPGARDDLGLSPDGRDWPRVQQEEVAEFLAQIDNPRERALNLLFVKYGLRVGELHNLDLQDMSVDFAPLHHCEYYESISTRPELEGREDVIYIDSNIARGTSFRGEVRRESNKRSVSTYLPLDGEMKHALVRWLAARPPTYNHPTHPLFPSPEVAGNENRYRRVSTDLIRDRLKVRAEEFGWNDRSGDDVTPHFFRHFFTTHHRLGMDDLIIDYIRGDTLGTRQRESPTKPSSGKAKNDYTHEEWLQGLKRPYLENVYKFGLPTLSVATDR